MKVGTVIYRLGQANIDCSLKDRDGRLEGALVKEQYFHQESSNNSMLYIK